MYCIFCPIIIISLVYKFKPAISNRLPLLFSLVAISIFIIHSYVYLHAYTNRKLPFTIGILSLGGIVLSWTISKLTLGIEYKRMTYFPITAFICFTIYSFLPIRLASYWVDQNKSIFLKLMEERIGTYEINQPKELSNRILKFSNQNGYNLSYCNGTYTFKIKDRPDVGFAKKGFPYECHPATSSFLFWKGHKAYNIKRSDFIKLENGFFIEEI
tara:strand:+ start:44 stop:685 length:642 start_codon:yes stop_codon:yes gene_type:complete